MTQLNEIINAIQSLFESESGYKISKEDARFRTIIKLYSYYTSLKEQ